MTSNIYHVCFRIYERLFKDKYVLSTILLSSPVSQVMPVPGFLSDLKNIIFCSSFVTFSNVSPLL